MSAGDRRGGVRRQELHKLGWQHEDMAAYLVVRPPSACGREELVEGWLRRFASRRRNWTRASCGGSVLCHCFENGVGPVNLSEPHVPRPVFGLAPVGRVARPLGEFGGGGIDSKTLRSNLMSTSDFAASLHGETFLQNVAADRSVKSVTAIGMSPDCCASIAAVAPVAIGETLCLSTWASETLRCSIPCAMRCCCFFVLVMCKYQGSGRPRRASRWQSHELVAALD